MKRAIAAHRPRNTRAIGAVHGSPPSSASPFNSRSTCAPHKPWVTPPSANELDGARFQGKLIAETANKLFR